MKGVQVLHSKEDEHPLPEQYSNLHPVLRVPKISIGQTCDHSLARIEFLFP